MESRLKKELEKKGIQIVELEGKIIELNNKIGALGGDIKVAAEGAEKARMEHVSLLNIEKDRYTESKDTDRNLRTQEANRVRQKLQKEMDDLKHENEVLREENNQLRIRESDLKTENGYLLDSVNKRSHLEECVVNIGLSNNYFKNVAEIFKKEIVD